jgi:hypothetical protein
LRETSAEIDPAIDLMLDRKAIKILSKQEFTQKRGLRRSHWPITRCGTPLPRATALRRTPAQQSEKIMDSNHLGIAPVPLGLVGSEVPIPRAGDF